MKNLLFSFIFLYANCFAQNYSLTFENQDKIKYDAKDWEIAARTSQFELYINKYSIATTEKVPAIYSLVEFYGTNGAKFEAFPTPVKKIYTYGIMECKNGIFHLLTSWYVDKNDKIIFKQMHEFGTYEVEVLTKNTPRNDLFLLVCSKFQ